uniref:Uncharacterized protein n=1 Tax=Globisporangium ultimum (strain ATCC 200006 / CBS 805.95 / DAOM BR144) TaxID=431595 RepID=K3X9L9_GLOUD
MHQFQRVPATQLPSPYIDARLQQLLAFQCLALEIRDGLQRIRTQLNEIGRVVLVLKSQQCGHDRGRVFMQIPRSLSQEPLCFAKRSLGLLAIILDLKACDEIFQVYRKLGAQIVFGIVQIVSLEAHVGIGVRVFFLFLFAVVATEATTTSDIVVTSHQLIGIECHCSTLVIELFWRAFRDIGKRKTCMASSSFAYCIIDTMQRCGHLVQVKGASGICCCYCLHTNPAIDLKRIVSLNLKIERIVWRKNQR